MSRKSKPIIIGEKGNEAKRSSFTINDTEKWEGQSLETPTTPLESDSGTGKAQVIRRYDFKLPPLKKDELRPTPEQLINHNRGLILSYLFKDGLEQIGDMRILVGKKNNFYIFVPAQPRLGIVLTEKPQTLSQITNARKTNSK